MARFWIGTSGWHYPHWVDSFYPEDLPSSRWLAFYARHFLTVEINNSFYRQPKTSAWELWRKAAPPAFRFAVKANRFLTHIKRLKGVEDSLAFFLQGAGLLEDRLGPILYQLPPNFQRTAENVARLEAFLSVLPQKHQYVLEFRHKSWFVEETFLQLRRHGSGYCAFDMTGLRPPLLATAPFAYMRFHGSDALYMSNYPDEELEVWARSLTSLAQEVDEVYVYFNNDAFGFAVANAQRLGELLGVAAGSQGQV
jgi:uncharacterized protein YecE (DUF72 family)